MYFRLDSGWQAFIIIGTRGREIQVPPEYHEIWQGTGTPLMTMKRQRSGGDLELLGTSTEDNTDSSEQDESSLRSSWFLVSRRSQQVLAQVVSCLEGACCQVAWPFVGTKCRGFVLDHHALIFPFFKMSTFTLCQCEHFPSSSHCYYLTDCFRRIV